MMGLIVYNSSVTGMPDPEVGMGVIGYSGSDRYPYTIVELITPKRIAVRADAFKRTDSNGYGGRQEYEYSPLPEAASTVLSLRRNGWWVPVGESMRNGRRYGLGERDAYRDPHF